MSASPPEAWPALEALCRDSDAVFRTETGAVSRREIVAAGWFRALRRELRGASALVRMRHQLDAAQAILACDGSVRRMVLCPPDFDDEHLSAVVEDAEVDVVLESGDGEQPLRLTRLGAPRQPSLGSLTEWVLFTSGTTGRPKLVVHTLEGLAGAIRPLAPGEPKAVWATFYDIRRYGGLQILLRALIGGADLVLSAPDEPVADFLARMGEAGATHVTGTPSHWRKALMSPAIRRIAPRYVRLSGEIADQAVLDGLRTAFPKAAIGHAYASTEAGVGFEVTDGLEGFPAAFTEGNSGPVEMRVVDGSLRIRSRRAASRYLGADAAALYDADGFVDTGDMVERRGDRWVFTGRRGGIINVGGLKIHPEEVEAVINRHPAVSMSRVAGRRNPITGAIVTAEAVLTGAEATRELKEEVLELCRAALPPHKVPASLKFVDSLAVTAGGKLERRVA